MKKLFITSILILLIMVLAISNITQTAAVKAEAYTKEELIGLINETQQIKDTSHEMAMNARELGWSDNDNILKEIKNKWHEADKEQKKYQTLLDAILAEEKRQRVVF